MLWAPGKTKIIVKRPKNIESEILALSRKVLAIHSSDTKNNIIIIWVILSQRISMGFHSACYRVCDQVQWLTAVTKSLKPQLKVRRSWIGSQRCVRTAAHPVERYDAKNTGCWAHCILKQEVKLINSTQLPFSFSLVFLQFRTPEHVMGAAHIHRRSSYLSQFSLQIPSTHPG